nr:MAG TPA: hypothetical protein [Bacteriophage sp.]
MDKINLPSIGVILAVKTSFLQRQIYVLIPGKVAAHPLQNFHSLTYIKVRYAILIRPGEKVYTTLVIKVWINFQKPFTVGFFYSIYFFVIWLTRSFHLSSLSRLPFESHNLCNQHHQTCYIHLLTLCKNKDVVDILFHPILPRPYPHHKMLSIYPVIVILHLYSTKFSYSK